MPKAPKPNICYHHYYYSLFKREVVCMHVVVNFGLCCRVNILRKMTNSIRHHISWFWKPFVHDKQLEKLWPNQYNATAEDYKSVCTSASPKFPFFYVKMHVFVLIACYPHCMRNDLMLHFLLVPAIKRHSFNTYM